MIFNKNQIDCKVLRKFILQTISQIIIQFSIEFVISKTLLSLNIFLHSVLILKI